MHTYTYVNLPQFPPSKKLERIFSQTQLKIQNKTLLKHCSHFSRGKNLVFNHKTLKLVSLNIYSSCYISLGIKGLHLIHLPLAHKCHHDQHKLILWKVNATPVSGDLMFSFSPPWASGTQGTQTHGDRHTSSKLQLDGDFKGLTLCSAREQYWKESFEA